MKRFSSLIKLVGSLALSAFIIFASLHFVSAQGTTVFQGPDGNGCYQTMYYQTPQQNAAYGCPGSFFDEECGAGGGGGGVPCSGFGYCQVVDCSSGNPGETTTGGGGPATITVNNSCANSTWSSSSGHTYSPFTVSPSSNGQTVTITQGSLPAGYGWNPISPSSSQLVYPDGSYVFNLSCRTLAVPTATLDASPNPYQCAGATTLSWSSQNATYCVGSWGGGNLATSGTQSVSPTGTQTYSVTCYGESGTTPATATKTVSEVANSCVGTASTDITSSNGNNQVNQGDDVTLSWTSQFVSSCDIQQLPSYPGYAWPHVPVNGSAVINPSTSSFYNIVCVAMQGAGNNPSDVTYVDVIPPPPVVNVTATPISGYAGSVNPSIAWSSTNYPTSCTATGSWATNGSKATNNSSGQSQGVLASTGTYTYILSCTNSGGTGTGSATVTVSAVPTIDLSAGSVTPTSTTVGVSTTFSSTITNSGNASTGSSFTNFFQVATATNGGGSITDLGGTTMSAVAAGGSAVTSKSNTFLTAGTYSMRACADKSSSGNAGTITESNENNNCGTWVDITVLPLPPAVTLTASPTSGYAGTVNPTLTWTTTNNPTSCTATVDWSGSKTTTGGSQSMGVLLTVKLYTYTLTCTNTGGSGSATATVNATAPPASYPDLTAGNITPTSATVGVATTFSATITNSGNASTGSSFSNYFKVATATNGGGTATEIGTVTSAAIAAGGSNPITQSHTFVSPGTYSMRACADKSSGGNAGTITESNENNNCGTWVDITVIDVPPVVTLAISPTSGYAGTVNPTLTWSATNNPTGCTATGNWTGAKASSGSLSLGVMATPGTYTYTLTCTNTGGSGSATVTLTVTTAPIADLVAGAASPSSATSGTPVNLSATITNSGNASTGASFTNLFQVASASNGGGTISGLAPVSMSTLAAGASAVSSKSYTFSSGGTFSIRACADEPPSPGGVIAESSESNCGSWTNVFVTPPVAGPDLTAGNVTPAAATLGVSTVFSSTITNSGGSSTGSSFSNFFQIASTTNGGGTVTDLGATSMSALAAGANAAASKSYTFSTPGTYSIRACADKSSSGNAGTVTESNEANNCSTWIDVVVPSFAPVVAISANPTTGYANNINSTLTWSATNSPTSCTASGSWSGPKNTSGGVQQTGVLTVAGVYTYILSCTNSGGTGTASTTVTVSGPPSGAASILVTSNKSNASWTIAPNGLSGSGTSGGPYYVVPGSGGTVYTITPSQIPNYTLVVSNTVTNTNSNSFALGVGETGRFDLTYSNIAGDFDYSLSTAAGDTNVIETGTPQFAQRVISKTLVSGSTQSVDLALTGVPAGVTYSFANQLCSPTCSTTINFTVSPTAPAGRYTITVTGNPLGKTAHFDLVITSSNAVLVSCFASPSPARVGEVVTWTSTVSGGTPPYASYVWTGSAPIPTSPAPSTPSFNVTYTTTGQKSALLTVTDSNGVSGSCSVPQAIVPVNFNPNFIEI